MESSLIYMCFDYDRLSIDSIFGFCIFSKTGRLARYRWIIGFPNNSFASEGAVVMKICA